MKPAIAAIAVLAAATAGAESYPTKPVRIIVPFAASGGTDIMARSLGRLMTPSLGQQVVVENRPGANGIIGAEVVAKAAPDGHTLLLTTNAITTSPWLYKSLPFDTEKDFAPVTLAGSAANLLAVHPSIPARSVKELIALARAHPGDLTIAGSGLGTPSHLAGELLKQTAKIDVLIVQYKGTGASLSDVVGGQVSMTFGALPGLKPFVRSQRLRALAVSSVKRNAAFPNVPALAEVLKGFEVLTWYGLLAPAGTPQEIVARLHREVVAALANPEMRQRLSAQGFDAGGMPPEAFAALIRKDLVRWGRVIRAANIRAQ
jgi:tripartite-type tricarboxylate transporter receptor subunit TctC